MYRSRLALERREVDDENKHLGGDIDRSKKTRSQFIVDASEVDRRAAMDHIESATGLGKYIALSVLSNAERLMLKISNVVEISIAFQLQHGPSFRSLW
jgi:hypothetical protein